MKNKLITKNLTKVYKTHEKNEGLKGSIKSLFRKKYIEKNAISSFDLEINKGEIIGLIGPNGAGKTTLIKMLTGIIHPTNGDITVFGYTPYQLKDDFKRQFSVVMGQKSQLWWDLPATDSFLLNKEIYGIKEKAFRNNLNYLTELFQVDKLLNIQVRNLSLGERMKMELIAALLHNPSVLFLDEPTIGLDAVAQKQIRQFLKSINEERGVTIIITSHYMDDIKYLCKRTVVVRNGVKIYDGHLDELINKYQIYRLLHVKFEKETDIKIDAEIVEKQPFEVVFKVKKENIKKAVENVMMHEGVIDISIENEDLADVVEKIYTEIKGVQ